MNVLYQKLPAILLFSASGLLLIGLLLTAAATIVERWHGKTTPAFDYLIESAAWIVFASLSLGAAYAVTQLVRYL